MITKQLPLFGTGLKVTGKILSIFVMGVFAISTLLSTSVSAQPLSEKEVIADFQKDASLFTPELIQKADKYVIYGDIDAMVLPTAESNLSKEELKLVKKGVQRYNLLSTETKKDSNQKNKEKFGHPSSCGNYSNGWAWWGFWQYFSGCNLDYVINDAGYAYTVAGIAISAICGPAWWLCGSISAVYVESMKWKFNDCKIRRGYAYLNTNWSGIPWVSC